jgi:hypothetical protein
MERTETNMTPDQVTDLLALFREQMETVKSLQAENARLREDPEGSTGATRYKPRKPERPTVNANIDDREWALFVDSWGRYKRMSKLKDEEVENIRLELRECCSSDVNKFLFEYIGSTKLDVATENQMMSYIKSVAVKVVHKEVHRMAFNSLVQDQGEPITQWVARLRAKAFLCEFEVPCTCCTPPERISYAEEEVAQRLVAGLCNQEHQRRVLSEADKLPTLEDKVNRLQVLETTEQSAQSLQRPPNNDSASTVSAARKSQSQYKSANKATSNKQQQIQQPQTPQKCRGCGSAPHTGGRKDCPAQNKECFRCHRKGHYGRVCESTDAGCAVEEDEEEEELPIMTSDASVSFSFGAEDANEDFRLGKKKTWKR